jgi:acetylornithine deacetylase/succinyl-diaminopimelate desuccinylase-like protein
VTPVELLQQLIRFDTTNPPGNEAECIAFVRALLEDAGCEVELYAKDPARPNLVARLHGNGDRPPILLQGHVDVVTTTGQDWSRPPFGGELVDGWVWGRGALDMKGGVAMMISAFLRALREGNALPGDVILCVLADEEAGGDYGAKFLVEEHPHLFEGVQYSLGEFGGFTLELGGRRLYPVQVAEKQICWLSARISGRGGHGAVPQRGGTMARLGKLLRDLDRKRTPVHVTAAARAQLEAMAAAVPRPTSDILRALQRPQLTDRVLPLLRDRAQTTEPLLRNTVSATIVRAGEKHNVVPATIEVALDVRALPGFGPEEVIPEVQELVGDDIELALVRFDEGPPEPRLDQFETLAQIIRELEPGAVPVPLLLAGVTDARFFARLGIQNYGFLPLKLPGDFRFASVIHAADERVPAEAIDFGAEAVFRALERLG